MKSHLFTKTCSFLITYHSIPLLLLCINLSSFRTFLVNFFQLRARGRTVFVKSVGGLGVG